MTFTASAQFLFVDPADDPNINLPCYRAQRECVTGRQVVPDAGASSDAFVRALVDVCGVASRAFSKVTACGVDSDFRLPQGIDGDQLPSLATSVCRVGKGLAVGMGSAAALDTMSYKLAFASIDKRDHHAKQQTHKDQIVLAKPCEQTKLLTLPREIMWGHLFPEVLGAEAFGLFAQASRQTMRMCLEYQESKWLKFTRQQAESLAGPLAHEHIRLADELQNIARQLLAPTLARFCASEPKPFAHRYGEAYTVMKLEQSFAQRTISLNLSLMGLDIRTPSERLSMCRLPDCLGAYSFVKHLNLRRNRIAADGLEVLRYLPQLESLNMSEMGLSLLPSTMEHLINLNQLNLDKNEFVEIPQVVCRLSSLMRLDIDNNKITAICAAIAGLKKLESLDVSANKLTFLPKELGLLRALKNFRAERNHIEMCLFAVRDMHNLQLFDLSGSCLLVPCVIDEDLVFLPFLHTCIFTLRGSTNMYRSNTTFALSADRQLLERP